ncbi:hypothetical protein CO110_09795 [Candidatus Desantisbacteria bacterium CG_4_9_14_3_um_filter_40_11]|uniref:Uncharacterized protein n=4 Tax=unclassified Candidatus Desantisiibacteriota TaxID=3106372 RepID=A0A2M7JDQ1_9BACT|nr:MAG: hypothetical protein COX18_00425 [Candidatus Desantisbacteria bacterium CG23_combo_of_CG06-09_8_20_14_all_40_23]PIX17527.1 MAG: hypothetical protein COZ71_02775 [Candidatus Desantisbacteria bacterium CG_4_8_14_3_um_filter_40_12]PIY18573.1 MAG: hypothetical protein COZ13_09895 [Candidatus Desantisbacteria bacterium CG_4_10_14_3_um_filter_40_18]PJB28357.1 MAG: hypothetical protein CO110_09795 [Candidatus Desantisbacteria bacterium CG_4_9_14_3_um_filter_40_11]
MKLSTQEKELYANKIMDLGNLILTGVLIAIILGQAGIRWYIAIAIVATFGYILCFIVSHLFMRR